jgi:glutaredoxin
MNVTVYTLPDCPKCDTIKEWLKKKEIDFDVRWFDTEAQTEFIMKNMFGNPPILTYGERIEPSESLFQEEMLKENMVLEVLGSG